MATTTCAPYLARSLFSYPCCLTILVVSPRGSLAQEADGEYAPGGSASCLSCHGESGFYPATDVLQTVHGRKSHPATPFAEGKQGYQSCHGPSAAHLSINAEGKRPPPAITFPAQDPPDAGNAACLDYHRREVGTIAASVHNFEALSCASCHRLHERDPATERGTKRSVLRLPPKPAPGLSAQFRPPAAGRSTSL